MASKWRRCAAISVAQRFSSDLKLNLHWHILLADGVWQERDGEVVFYPADPLDTIRVQETLHDAVLRITKALTKRGWQDREDDPFAEQEPGLSALWRAALVGKPIDPATEQPKRAGLKKLPKPEGRNCSRYLGFSLHAGVYSCAPSVRQSGPGRARGPLSAGEVPVSPFGVSAAGPGPTRWALRADAQDSVARRHAGVAPKVRSRHCT